ncbi:cytochrome b/b6 domain-containing protein [Pseudomonas sp.]|uniref:cytochrome b n=1 Tax=Pseudomonas sp. TaxID=306 RepID=UPI001B04D991|nr:cytochrome b/b6 domain-containing protein [Pseudomonas sp.]MBO9551690.1 cytochrome b/b6 domain-containing protein [Pseudomonas sp.]
MSVAKYSPAQIALHWLSAAIILWSLCAGTYMSLFDVSQRNRLLFTALNISLTTLFIPFFVVRVWLRLAHLRKHPAVPGERLARFVHNIIYLATGMVLATGVLMMDRPIVVFEVLTLPAPLSAPDVLEVFHRLHRYSTEALGGLVGLHLLAVIKHELSGHRVLRNMGVQPLPWKASGGQIEVAPAPGGTGNPAAPL